MFVVPAGSLLVTATIMEACASASFPIRVTYNWFFCCAIVCADFGVGRVGDLVRVDLIDVNRCVMFFEGFLEDVYGDSLAGLGELEREVRVDIFERFTSKVS